MKWEDKCYTEGESYPISYGEEVICADSDDMRKLQNINYVLEEINRILKDKVLNSMDEAVCILEEYQKEVK